eukprot:jgi/Botrbrau1/4845/Bobra.0032s0006.1
MVAEPYRRMCAGIYARTLGSLNPPSLCALIYIVVLLWPPPNSYPHGSLGG